MKRFYGLDPESCGHTSDMINDVVNATCDFILLRDEAFTTSCTKDTLLLIIEGCMCILDEKSPDLVKHALSILPEWYGTIDDLMAAVRAL